MAGDLPPEITPEALLPLAVGALAVGLPAAALGFRLLLRRSPSPKRASPATPLDLVLTLPILLLSELFVGLGLVGIYGEEGAIPPAVSLAAVSLFLAPLVAYALLRARGRGGAATLGLESPAPGTIATCLGAWLLCLPLLFGLVWLSPSLYGWLGFDWKPQAHGEGLAQLRGWSLGVGGILAAVVIPFLEELVFRGWLQQGLARLFGSRLGVLLVATLFTLNHDRGVWIPIFVLALLLGIARERFQNLWASVAIHMAHNGLQVLMIIAGLQMG